MFCVCAPCSSVTKFNKKNQQFFQKFYNCMGLGQIDPVHFCYFFCNTHIDSWNPLTFFFVFVPDVSVTKVKKSLIITINAKFFKISLKIRFGSF